MSSLIDDNISQVALGERRPPAAPRAAVRRSYPTRGPLGFIPQASISTQHCVWAEENLEVVTYAITGILRLILLRPL